jgi:hypothetical protein
MILFIHIKNGSCVDWIKHAENSFILVYAHVL